MANSFGKVAGAAAETVGKVLWAGVSKHPGKIAVAVLAAVVTGNTLNAESHDHHAHRRHPAASSTRNPSPAKNHHPKTDGTFPLNQPFRAKDAYGGEIDLGYDSPPLMVDGRDKQGRQLWGWSHGALSGSEGYFTQRNDSITVPRQEQICDVTLHDWGNPGAYAIVLCVQAPTPTHSP